MGQQLRLRKGYVFIDENRKAVEGRTIFDSDEPMVSRQAWKFEPASPDELAQVEVKFDATALTTMKRDELMELYADKIGEPSEDITVTRLRMDLRKHFSDLAHDEG